MDGKNSPGRRRVRLASLGATTLLLFLVLLPGKDIPQVPVFGIDKLVHTLMFGGWTLAVRFDFRGLRRRRLLAFAACLGIGSELLQLLVPGRSFDVLDFAFDLFGAGLALRFGEPLIALADRAFGGRKATSDSETPLPPSSPSR